jgi:D-alanine-D-alanine ligase-like ATP-grasp enzyme
VNLAERLACGGKASRQLATRVDLLHAAGARYYLRRVRSERRFPAFEDEARNGFYERMWQEAAQEVGARTESLAPGLLELHRAEVSTRVFQQMVDLDDPVTLRVALDKALVHRLLSQAGITIPEHIEFRVEDPEPALAFLARSDGPCVVKPAAGTGGGYGTTAGISCPSELLRARLHASKTTDRLLIERQAAGDVYRLLLLEGELLDVVRSTPARLTGDGSSTIAKLIAAESERRVAARGAAGMGRLGINLDTVLALEHQGLSLSSVLPPGRSAAIRTITSDNGTENNHTFSGPVAEELIAEASAAAAAAGLALAGVDVITSDPSRALAHTSGVINEVNGTPGLHHHYLFADPDHASRVAIPILERLLRREHHV